MCITVQNVIDKLVAPANRLPVIVDALKSGNPDMRVTGIVTTFMATYNVLREAIELGANLIITHEGVFYRHLGKSEALENDAVFLEKQRLIDESGMAIFRFHDSIHRCRPDGIMAGLLQSLGWEEYVQENKPAATILTIPSVPLGEVVRHVKGKLGIDYVRVAGDVTMNCSRVGLLVGYRGTGENAIPLFGREQLDLIIAGEGPEWETPEYVRDAVSQGKRKAFILLGHAESEEPGMRYLADLMTSMFPGIPVHFLSARPCFQIL